MADPKVLRQKAELVAKNLEQTLRDLGNIQKAKPTEEIAFATARVREARLWIREATFEGGTPAAAPKTAPKTEPKDEEKKDGAGAAA